jgi:hypothetical protein
VIVASREIEAALGHDEVVLTQELGTNLGPTLVTLMRVATAACPEREFVHEGFRFGVLTVDDETRQLSLLVLYGSGRDMVSFDVTRSLRRGSGWSAKVSRRAAQPNGEPG